MSLDPAARRVCSNLIFGRFFRRAKGITAASTCCALAAFSTIGGSLNAQTPGPASYFEFGKVVAIGHGSIDIQTFDQQRQRLVQHSFALTRETRADIVHVNDTVEVVFVNAASGWELRRMITLGNGIPVPGTPPALRPEVATIAPSSPVPPAATASVPSRTTVIADAAPAKAKPARKAVQPAALPAPAKQLPARSVAAASLGTNNKAKTSTGVVPVELGSPAENAARVAARKTRDVAIARPAEECNRSSDDWPTEPVHIAVLDFRYPTEREEAHDIGTTGGGSGTAVADLVFARLETDEESNDQFVWSRADRRRLDRSDFAGAARLGRQLGVDAVLAGTFVPVEDTSQPAEAFPPPRAYELKAGLVDTCTGQLLIQVSSLSCAGGLEPGVTTGTDPASCTHLSMSPRETADPKAHPQAFKPALDAMLYPLEHDGLPPGRAGSAGTVAAILGKRITVQLSPRTRVQPGEQVAVLASRIAKNATTYTLRTLQSEEIGRVTLESVQGQTAVGTFTGDYVPRLGDTVNLLTE